MPVEGGECSSRGVPPLEETDVGGVWMIGAVDVEDVDKQYVSIKPIKVKTKASIETHNGFSIFEESEEEEDEEQNVEVCAILNAQTLTRASGFGFQRGRC